MARSAAALLILGILASAGLASCSAGVGDPAPLSLWASGAYLTAAADRKAVPAVQVLDELFAAVAGLGDTALSALDGLLDRQQLAAQPPRAVVVLASAGGAAEAAEAAVSATAAAAQQKLAELRGAAASSLHLPNAVHEGAVHPVFAGLRRSAGKLAVTVLGECTGAVVPGAQPATPEALRQALEAAGAEAGAAGAAAEPAVVVMCPAGDSEAELLAAAQQVLSGLAPAHHLLVHAAVPGAAAEAGAAAQQRRRLMAAGSGDGSREAAARTANYTTCDATCRKHVMIFEGLIIAVVMLIALVVGCCCMHIVDVPTRFAQPDTASRQHQD